MELASLEASSLAHLVRTRQASPVEVVEAVLERARATAELNAWVTLDEEGALRQARDAAVLVEQVEDLGALHGVPVTIKDFPRVRGLPNRRGSRLTSDEPSHDDSPLVRRLRGAGAIIMGTTTSSERGWTAVGSSPLTGHTHNPWRHGVTSGGSSAGAAALAGAGCGPLHVGTDGAGSIRLPAHFCGVVGFKPTFGRIPYAPLPNNSNISHAGPITRSVADAALMYAVMAGADPLDHTSLPGDQRRDVEPGGLRGLRVAYSTDLGHARVDPGVASVVRTAVTRLSDLGAVVEEITPVWGPLGRDLEREMWGLAMLPYLPDDDTQEAAMDPGLVACARSYEFVTAREAVSAYGRRIEYAAMVNSWFGSLGFDLLVTPAASVTAFPVGRQIPDHWPQHAWDWIAWAEFSYPFNLAHGPAISIPVGFDEGLPVGMQIAGPRLADDLVLRAAEAYAHAYPFPAAPGVGAHR